MDQKQRENIGLFKILLQLQENVVGVKFLKTKDEYSSDSSRELIKKMPYCVAVRCAIKGHAIKLKRETSGCSGSSRALGLISPDDSYYSGMRGYEMGLYENPNIACKIANEFCILENSYYGVAIKPLEEWDDEPDCVLLIANAYTIMRIIQGYIYHFGSSPQFRMTGNQGICIECTAYPYYHNTLSVSFLCSGTRYNAGWEDDMAGVGMAFSIFDDVVNGIYRTANATEPNERKLAINEELCKKGYDIQNIRVGEAYYMKDR